MRRSRTHKKIKSKQGLPSDPRANEFVNAPAVKFLQHSTTQAFTIEALQEYVYIYIYILPRLSARCRSKREGSPPRSTDRRIPADKLRPRVRDCKGDNEAL